ncbi:LuxR family transcriptional regulator [Nocardioides daphniae]|uniref:LuxR family transcriptional regulator n=1 Tax=Nocardioides daphniae TaxID=402297 RepID=A0A4P7UDS3_9ACTN|nr:LuxR family transcriptional regulator [Nocardioides daphniae]QCC78410.1 LuxR family transcriptional regulator [Nocardioides daphniae]GGD12690.1 LuxR family transcriptional regulator [Nocardioides daphniae]
MPQYGPEDRELFEQVATPLYEAVVATGSISADDARLAVAETRAAFDLLVRMGLLVAEGDRMVPVDPSTVSSLVVAPMGQQGATLISESAHWAQAFTGLGHMWRKAPGVATGAFTEVRGEAINPFIASVVADAEFELLTAQPQTGRNAATLAAATQRDIAALERGVKMRTLYQHSARRSRVTHKYVAAVSARGAEVRTLDEFFNRLIVVDRRIAVVPGHEGLAVALAVREPSMVAYLVDMFERTWERSRPFANRESTVSRDIAAEQRAMTIRMLIAGYADPASAKRLGVSPRTYAGYVSELKAEFEAQTRFQLGYEMGRRGVSGQEVFEESDGD